MSELDIVKQQIAYLTVWLGMMVITNISLFGWLVINFGHASPRIVYGCIICIVAVSTGIFILHRRIERHIENLRNL